MNENSIKVDNLFEKFSKKLRKMDLSTAFIIEIASYFIAGFILGFLFKNLWRYIFFLIIALAFGFWLSQKFDFVTINYSTIKTFWGISNSITINSIFYMCLDWIKINIYQAIAFLVGFFISWKFI